MHKLNLVVYEQCSSIFDFFPKRNRSCTYAKLSRALLPIDSPLKTSPTVFLLFKTSKNQSLSADYYNYLTKHANEFVVPHTVGCEVVLVLVFYMFSLFRLFISVSHLVIVIIDAERSDPHESDGY